MSNNLLIAQDPFNNDEADCAAVDAALTRIEDERSKMRAAVSEYRTKGFNVIPLVHETKRAVLKYARWHNHRQTDDEVALMLPRFSGGVAIITGAISGVICIDCDGPEGDAVLREWESKNSPLPTTWTIRSGSGRGVHRYFKHPGVHVKSKANLSIKLDIKGDGGIAVAPPTLHKSGNRYAVEVDAPIAALPAGLLEFIERKAAEAEGKSGKSGAFDARSQRSAKLDDNVSWRVPVNKRNAAIIKSMLDTLPDEYADEHDKWLCVGFALHSFENGDVGLTLWRKFSERCPSKAAQTDFATTWAGFDRPYTGNRITLGTLYKLAMDHGWKPIPWDYREPNKTA